MVEVLFTVMGPPRSVLFDTLSSFYIKEGKYKRKRFIYYSVRKQNQLYVYLWQGIVRRTVASTQ